MPFALLALVVVAGLALAVGWRRRERALRQELDGLTERLQQLTTRLEVTEQAAGQALDAADVSAQLLVDKGIADEDELDDVRKRLGEGGPPRDGDDALH
jgi:type VI protein secretion system component VasK